MQSKMEVFKPFSPGACLELTFLTICRHLVAPCPFFIVCSESDAALALVKQE